MKLILLIILLSVTAFLATGQVEIKPSPLPGFEQRIRAYTDSLPVVDTHEHLMDPKKIRRSTLLDFMLLFHHFADDDLISAGMPPNTFQALLGDSLSVKEKWLFFKPYWEKTFNTSFNRVSMLAARKLFGISELNGYTVELLSKRIREAYQADWFNTVLKEKCNISFLIQDFDDNSFGNEGFRHVKRLDHFINIASGEDIAALTGASGKKPTTFDELLNLLRADFQQAVSEGVVAIKIGVAYTRPLNFENPGRDKAKKLFLETLSTPPGQPLSFQEVKPLQDFMLHRIIGLAREFNLPVQIHTGLQAGNGNKAENANPTLLTNLFQSYPQVKFVLFHGGYPFGGEIATLAKNFPNVYIDLCWVYAISPSYSQRYLHEWLETVPACKIMGFGGDYHNVENVYAELLMARQIISTVLTEKISTGYFNEAEAKLIARMLLYENALNFYNLVSENPKPDGS